MEEFGEVERKKKHHSVQEVGHMAQDGKDDRRVKRSRLALRPPLGEASAHSVTHGSGRDVERLDWITRTFCEDLLRGRSVRVTIVTDRTGLRCRWH